MESKDDKKTRNDENYEIPSFNSATDHYKTIMGTPTNRVDLKKMPRPLRYFGYFVFVAMATCSIIFIIMLVLQNFF